MRIVRQAKHVYRYLCHKGMQGRCVCVCELTLQVVEQGRELPRAGGGQDEGELGCHVCHLEEAGT